VGFWLDRLMHGIHSQMPFSVLGAVYAGSNWDSFADDDIPVPLRRHLNGNAVYNVTHPFLLDMLSKYSDELWTTVKHSSFDVQLSEALFQDRNVSLEDAEQVYGYKATPLIANLASTLVVPRDLPDTAIIVHGAVYLQEWPVPGCAPTGLGVEGSGAYPRRMLGASSATSLTLLISDLGNGGIDRLLASLQAAEEHLARPSCAGSSLPFSRVLVLTHDEVSAERAARAFLRTPAGHYRLCRNAFAEAADPDASACGDSGIPVEIELRDTGASAWWDICKSSITTEWFVQVTSDFTLARNFKLPVDTDKTGTRLHPVCPFLEFDSEYCRRECRAEVERAQAAILPTINRHYLQAHTVYRTDIRSGFCGALDAANDRLPDPVDPSPSAYFAYVHRVIGAQGRDMRRPAVHLRHLLPPSPSQPLLSRTEQLCAGQADPPQCSSKAVQNACARQDVVGTHFRQVCRLACGTCAAELRQARQIVRERWYPLWADRIRREDEVYMQYDRLRYFLARGLVGAASRALCEDSVDFQFDACPCRFPFFHNNESHMECIVTGNSPYLTCPTSLPNVRPHAPLQPPLHPSPHHSLRCADPRAFGRRWRLALLHAGGHAAGELEHRGAFC